MKDKIAIVGAGLRPTTVAALAQRLIEKDMVKVEELKKDNDVFLIKNHRIKDKDEIISTMPEPKLRTKPCTKHEYTEIRRKDKDNIIYSTWVCRHCTKTLK